jgi:hypothetical protein
MTDIADNKLPDESDPDTELLTSYLDGELDDAEIQAVEQRIASDSQFRLQMQSLQKTWDLLDALPVESADSSFTRTTMEMVVDDARGQLKASKGHGWKRPLKLFGLIALPIALFAGSFLLARSIQREDQLKLVEIDLPVIEKSDHYLAVDEDLDFLLSLHRSGLFSDESALYSDERDELVPDLSSEATPSSNAGSPATDKFARLEAMDAHQRDSLRRKREKFVKMTAEQQSSLRQFHEQINTHTKTKELRETLNDYFDWLGTLRSRDRAELADMSADDRLSAIAKTLINRARREFGRAGITQLPLQDARAVFDWYDAVVKGNEAEIRRLFGELVEKRNREKRRNLWKGRLNELRSRPLNQLVGVLVRVDQDRDVRYYRNSIKEILYVNIDRLVPKLSLEAAEILDSQTTNGKKELLLKWTEAANQTRSKVTIVQLQKFYEQLSTEQRDELDRMSFENWEGTLTRLYRETQLSRSSDTNDLSDVESVKSLLEESGLEVPEQSEDDLGISDDDMGMSIDLDTELNVEDLKMSPEIKLIVPDGLIDELSAEDDEDSLE